MDVLSQEILDTVIGIFGDDKKTLCSLALVCKAWLPRSRHHIFKKMYISPLTMGACLGLMRYASFPLCDLVRHLVFSEKEWQHVTAESIMDSADGFESFRSVVRLEVSFIADDFRRLKPSTWTSFSSAFPALTSLHLRTLEIPGDMLITFLENHPLLESLTFKDLALGAPLLPPIPGRPPAVQPIRYRRAPPLVVLPRSGTRNTFCERRSLPFRRRGLHWDDLSTGRRQGCLADHRLREFYRPCRSGDREAVFLWYNGFVHGWRRDDP